MTTFMAVETTGGCAGALLNGSMALWVELCQLQLDFRPSRLRHEFPKLLDLGEYTPFVLYLVLYFWQLLLDWAG